MSRMNSRERKLQTLCDAKDEKILELQNEITRILRNKETHVSVLNSEISGLHEDLRKERRRTAVARAVQERNSQLFPFVEVRIVKFNGLTRKNYMAAVPESQRIPEVGDIVTLQERFGRIPVGLVTRVDYARLRKHWNVTGIVGHVSYPSENEDEAFRQLTQISSRTRQDGPYGLDAFGFDVHNFGRPRWVNGRLTQYCLDQGCAKINVIREQGSRGTFAPRSCGCPAFDCCCRH